MEKVLLLFEQEIEHGRAAREPKSNRPSRNIGPTHAPCTHGIHFLET